MKVMIIAGAAVLLLGVVWGALKWAFTPKKGIRIGPYGQIEGEPSDDPYDPPSMRGGG